MRLPSCRKRPGRPKPRLGIYEERVVKRWMQRIVFTRVEIPFAVGCGRCVPSPGLTWCDTVGRFSEPEAERGGSRSPLWFIELRRTRREDAQPSIQDRAATRREARGKHVLRNRIQRDATIHPDEARWKQGHRLLAQIGVIPSRLDHPFAGQSRDECGGDYGMISSPVECLIRVSL